jgi:hypothetical protein
MTRVEIILRLSLSSVLLAVATWYTIEAASFTTLARYAPQTAGAAATVLLTAVVVREALRLARYSPETAAGYGRTIEYVEDDDSGVTTEILITSLKYLAWLVGFVVVIWLLGLVLAAPIFLAVFLLVDAKSSLAFTAVSIVAVLLIMWLFGNIGFTWPAGVLISV